MKCPGCKEPMIVLELDGVEADFCTVCGGIWLDRGELELLFEKAGADGGFLQTGRQAGGSQEKAGRCPSCRKKMAKVIYGDSPAVGIDQCPKGHGLWLESGELETMIDMPGAKDHEKLHSWLRDIFKNISQERSPQ